MSALWRTSVGDCDGGGSVGMSSTLLGVRLYWHVRPCSLLKVPSGQRQLPQNISEILVDGGRRAPCRSACEKLMPCNVPRSKVAFRRSEPSKFFFLSMMPSKLTPCRFK